VWLPSVTKALVSGEAFPPSLRIGLLEQVTGYQYTRRPTRTDRVYETEAREGLVLMSGASSRYRIGQLATRYPKERLAELVVTTMNPDYPLIRFSTGDLSAVLFGQCPTGRKRPHQRVDGPMTKRYIRGMLVHPGRLQPLPNASRKSPKRVWSYRRDGQRQHDLLVETNAALRQAEGLDQRISEARFGDVTKLRGQVRVVEAGTLPNDGKVD
jgi:phenylacetate-CoA ligase